jgi:signal transduction histidine kinase
VTADPDRLGQALYNLLDNAARFTPPRGTVRLYARRTGDVVTLGVSDTGIGIPPEDQARVCEPFYQVRRAGAERDGSGLGLAIVKEIVGRHGATLRLQSSPGGTTWEFDLAVTPGG